MAVWLLKLRVLILLLQVVVNYVAMTPEGRVFDSSLDKKQLYEFRFGTGSVIPGRGKQSASSAAGFLRCHSLGPPFRNVQILKGHVPQVQAKWRSRPWCFICKLHGGRALAVA